MFVKQFEEKGLAHYSYVVGSQQSGQVAVIDPCFGTDTYLKYAEKNSLVISHVFDTHIHSDYLSKARYLAIRARARLMLSGYDKGEEYEVIFPHKECFDEDCIKIGAITLEVLHTPGHTPEQISLLAWEDGKPKILFSGDFLLVGSTGGPDFTELARAKCLFHKLYDVMKEKICNLPDSIIIYPAHGAGVLYGMKIGNASFSTLGQERLTNPFLKPNLSKSEFVALALSHTHTPPAHCYQIKSYNISNEWNETVFPSALDLQTFQKHLKKGDIVIDLRDAKTFYKRHIPSSICIGSGDKVGFWASRMLPFNQSLLIVTDNPIYIDKVIHALARVGYQIKGYLKGGIETWKLSKQPLQTIVAMTPHEINEKMCAHQLIDVRSLEEWNMGHISYAKHIPCCELSTKIKALPLTSKLVFICAGNYRSILAASCAKYLGHKAIAYVPGGIPVWQKSGFPLVTD